MPFECAVSALESESCIPKRYKSPDVLRQKLLPIVKSMVYQAHSDSLSEYRRAEYRALADYAMVIFRGGGVAMSDAVRTALKEKLEDCDVLSEDGIAFMTGFICHLLRKRPNALHRLRKPEQLTLGLTRESVPSLH